MIVKRVGRAKGTSSFERLAVYVLDQAHGGEKVAFARVTNCASDDPRWAMREVAAVQGKNTRSRADKTCHLVVSFRPGDAPTPEQLADIEQELASAIGLGDHQRLSALHRNTGHPHLHIAINTVHPRTLRNVHVLRDYHRLDEACARLEDRHGLEQDNRIARALRDDRARAYTVGDALRGFASAEESYALLGDATTWTSGGCWLLAESLHQVVGGSLCAVVDEQGRPQHVVLQLGSLYLDADGASSLDDLTHRWNRELHYASPEETAHGTDRPRPDHRGSRSLGGNARSAGAAAGGRSRAPGAASSGTVRPQSNSTAAPGGRTAERGPRVPGLQARDLAGDPRLADLLLQGPLSELVVEEGVRPDPLLRRHQPGVAASLRRDSVAELLRQLRAEHARHAPATTSRRASARPPVAPIGTAPPPECRGAVRSVYEDLHRPTRPTVRVVPFDRTAAHAAGLDPMTARVPSLVQALSNTLPERVTPLPSRAADLEAHGGEASFLRWARAQRPAIEAARDAADSWAAFHHALGELGLRADLRGAGLVLRSASGAMVKASQVSRGLSLRQLQTRWGPHHASPTPLVPTAPPPREPLQRSPKAPELYAAFQRARNDALAARKELSATKAQDELKWKLQTEHTFDRRRTLIKQDRSLSPAHKRQQYRELAKEKRELLQAHRANLRSQRQALLTQQPLPTWNEFLRQRAEGGDLQALEVLRARDQKQARVAAQVLAAPNAAAAQHVVMHGAKRNFRKNGDVLYELSDGGVVRDGAQEVEVEGDSTTGAAFAALALAAQRFPGQPLVVEGTPAFRAQVAAVAATRGLDVRFADPDLEATRAAAEAPAAAAAQSAAVESFISARNAQAQRTPAVLHHRLWDAGDAGEAIYRGRRQLEGVEAVLLERGGEMLVKPVTSAQAAKSSTIPLGTRVQLDDRGRYRSVDPSAERE